MRDSNPHKKIIEWPLGRLRTESRMNKYITHTIIIHRT